MGFRALVTATQKGYTVTILDVKADMNASFDEKEVATNGVAHSFRPGVTNLLTIAGHFVRYHEVRGPHNFLVILNWSIHI